MTTVLNQDSKLESQVEASPVELLEAVAAAKANQEKSPSVYRCMAIGDGHSQGDCRIQYLGTELDSNTRQSLVAYDREFTSEGYLSIGSTSHVLASQSIKAYQPEARHPLIEMFFYTEVPFTVQHPEHRWMQFEQPGWYVARFDRDGMTSESDIEQPLRLPPAD